MLRKAVISLLVSVAAALTALPSLAQNTKSQESRKAKLEQEIALINKQLQDNSSKSTTALNRLNLVRKQISNRQELLRESEREVASLTREINALQARVRQLEARYDTLSAHYTAMVRAAYKNRDPKIWYMFILASDDLGQAFRRVGYLKSLSRELSDQAEKIRLTKEELEAEQESLSAARLRAQELRDRRQKEMNQLKKEENQSDELVKRLKKDRNRYQKDLAAKKKQVEALNREIERIIRQATGGPKGTKTEVDYALDAEFSKNKGRLPWPADGAVVEKYGQNYDPVLKVQLPFNNGVTMSVAAGTKVKAVFDGVVKQIVVMPGYNKCVLVQHGNYFTFYCKLSDVDVKPGARLKTGDVIGTVVNAGSDTQLHFQVWKGTSPQNPETWLR